MNKNNNYITLGQKIIGANSRPYIIAEIGVNHEGSLDLAKELIFLAKEGGADAAKFQTYKADTIASKLSPAYWDTKRKPLKVNMTYLRNTIILKKKIILNYMNIVKN